jgi:hypothetical protein
LTSDQRRTLQPYAASLDAHDEALACAEERLHAPLLDRLGSYLRVHFPSGNVHKVDGRVDLIAACWLDFPQSNLYDTAAPLDLMFAEYGRALADGKARRDAPLDLHERYQPGVLRRARLASFHRQLEAHESVSAADVHYQVAGIVAAGMDRRAPVADPGPLAKANNVVAIGSTNSSRPSRHAGANRTWSVADRAATDRCIGSFPVLPGPDSGGLNALVITDIPISRQDTH